MLTNPMKSLNNETLETKSRPFLKKTPLVAVLFLFFPIARSLRSVGAVMKCAGGPLGPGGVSMLLAS
eukprot:1132546-Amphidinium_carterae.1